MLNTLFLILKIIGIVLLCIIGILLLIVMLVMFVPVRYKGNASKENGEDNPLYALAGVSWLLHIVSAAFEYRDGKTKLTIKVFGFRIRSKEERRERKRRREEKHKKKKITNRNKDEKKNKNRDDGSEYIIYEYNKDGTEVRTEHGGKNGKTTVYVEEHEEGLDIDYPVENNELTDTDPPHDDKTDENSSTKAAGESPISEKLKGLTEKAGQIAKKIGISCKKLTKGLERTAERAGDALDNIDYYHTALCNDSKNREVIRLLVSGLKRLLKAVKPRKVKGHLEYGSDDPSSTGKVLAGAAVLYPWYGRNIVIEPDFCNEVLAFDIFIKGRIYLCVVVKILLQLYFNRKVKRFIRIMKKENSVNGK